MELEIPKDLNVIRKEHIMKKIISILVLSILTLSAFAEGQSEKSGNGAEWPKGSVQFVVPAKAGGGTDAAARILAKALQEKLGKPFVVVNQPSGGGSVASETVRNSKTDGSTILFYHSGMFSSYHTGQYDHSPSEEFTTCAVMPVDGSYSLVVGPDSPYSSIEDLIAATRTNPGKITLGVQLKGSSHFMAGLLIKDSDAQFKIVEAGSDADKLVAVQGGTIDAAFVNTPGALQYAEADKLNILATIAGFSERDPGAPDYPSLYELGYESAVYGLDFFILGPAGLDPAVAEKVNLAFKEVMSDPAVSGQFDKMHMPLRYLPLADSETRLVEGDRKIGETAAILGLK